MPRLQIVKSYVAKTVAAAATPERLQATSEKVCSIILQALPTNTDYVYWGDSVRQNVAIAPGKAVTITGDNLDNGTAAFFDLTDIFIRVTVNGEGVSYGSLSGS